jgi:tRNA(Ile)-lysidine synthase TilS/MesJ
MALVRMLLDLQRKWPLQLLALHCNHGMRTDSGANAVWVSRALAALGVECVLRTCSSSLTSEVSVTATAGSAARRSKPCLVHVLLSCTVQPSSRSCHASWR